MKTLVLTVVLAVMQAAPPVPRQAADNNAYGATKVKDQRSSKKQSSPDSPTSLEKIGGGTGDNPAAQIAHYSAAKPIAISETTTVAEKSWWDKLYVIFTGLLVIAGFAGILYAYRTLKVLYKQTYAIRRQAVLMRRSTRASEKSIRMQEIQLMQFVDVEGIRTRVNNVHGRVPEGVTQTPLFIDYEILNSTGMVLTLNWLNHADWWSSREAQNLQPSP